MIQIAIYKDSRLFANMPVKCIYPIARIPFNVIQLIRQFASGESSSQQFGPWKWKFKT